MIETLAYVYLAVGAIHSLVVLWASFAPDFDDFVRETYREEPPTRNEKLVVVASSLLLWPLFLWRMLS